MRLRASILEMTHIFHILMAAAAGGALGAVFRFVMTARVHRFAPATFPWGTFNRKYGGAALYTSGSVVLGILGLLLGLALANPFVQRV